MNVIPYRNKKRPRTTAKTYPKPRMLKYNGEFKMTRTVIGSMLTSSTGFQINAGSGAAINIVFDPQNVTIYRGPADFVVFAIPNASEYISLFDLIRIDKVEFTWSTTLQAGNSTTAAAIPPRFLVCNDVNDAGATTPTVIMVQQQNPKSFYSADGREHKWSVRPKFQRVVYQTAAVSNYEASTGFVNSNSFIPHYGIRMAMSNTNLQPTPSGMDMSFKMYFTLKNVK